MIETGLTMIPIKEVKYFRQYIDNIHFYEFF